MRSLVQMKSAPCATSISARNDTRPTAMRQYRLRYHGLVPLYIRGLVAGAPDGEYDRGIRRVLFDLLTQALDQRVHASHGHERLVLPDAGEKRLAGEDDAGVEEQHVEKLELVRGELHVLVADTHAAPRRIHLNVPVRDRPGRLPRCAHYRSRAATQQRADPRDELTHAERLGQVVVRSAF